MPTRHPRIPTLWLMTDERLGAGLWDAIRRLPRGSGIVFRHYATPRDERRRLFQQVVRMARARGLVVVRAGEWAGPGEQGRHNAGGAGLLTAAAHDRREAVKAVRRGAMVVFVSPVFATRSHSGGKALGARGAQLVVRGLSVVAIALGGMDERRFRGLTGFDGWAGIDAWL